MADIKSSTGKLHLAKIQQRTKDRSEALAKRNQLEIAGKEKKSNSIKKS